MCAVETLQVTLPSFIIIIAPSPRRGERKEEKKV
jgi:hypothetical protein